MLVEPRPLWRLRAGRLAAGSLPAVVLIVVAIALLRLVAAPAPPDSRPTSTAAGPDLAAAAFATLFVRHYLSWQPSDPEARRRALEGFGGSDLAPEAGSEPPARGAERVLWDQVVQERQLPEHMRVFTVQAETEPRGLQYLAVTVLRRADGRLALASYPAFVGAPATSPADPIVLEGAEVDDAALRAVVSRALHNYLAPAPAELAADLVPGAQVSTPRSGLVLEELQRLTWGRGPDQTVVAQVTASGSGGARFTLAYEIAVRRLAGRWEIGAIEADPDA